MRRRRFFEFDEMFPDFGEIEKMFEEMMKDFDNMKPVAMQPGKPLVYGFSMRVGPDGRPHVEEFGNVSPKAPSKENKKVFSIKQEREPLVDVINGEKEVTVIAELPGVDRKDLQLNAEKTSLHIGVTDPKRRFKKQLKLPSEVDVNSAKAKLKNGILEVVLTKKKLESAHSKEKRMEIKVE